MCAAPHYAAPACNGRNYGPRPMPEETIGQPEVDPDTA